MKGLAETIFLPSQDNGKVCVHYTISFSNPTHLNFAGELLLGNKYEWKLFVINILLKILKVNASFSVEVVEITHNKILMKIMKMTFLEFFEFLENCK